MSMQALDNAWNRKGLRAEAKLMLLYLADIADDRDRCSPSLEWIAAKCETTPVQTRAILRSLERSGVLRMDEAGSYQLTLAADR